jgi:hypothetical protein
MSADEPHHGSHHGTRYSNGRGSDGCAPPPKDDKRKETKKVTDQEWRALLTPFEYDVLRRGGTEPAFSGEYDSYYPDAGHFACKGCKAPL